MREERPRRWWGWGHLDEGLDEAEARRLSRIFRDFLGLTPREPAAPPSLEAVRLPAPRLRAADAPCPAEDGAYWRISRSAGKSTRELLALRRGEVRHAPDVVAFPRNRAEIVALLEWADQRRLAVVPFGGGTSVTGGVEPVVGDGFEGVLTIDMTAMGRLLEIDDVSRLVRAEAGILTPALDAALKPRGLTLRHYPQSYMYTTLGGWIVTRSAGHFAMLQGRFDDRVAGLGVVTPRGFGDTRVLPGSSIGPDPDRLWIGSEGTLGIVDEAWVRVLPVPDHRAVRTLAFADMARALEATRAIAQSGLWPSHLRLLDPFEAMVSGALTAAHGPAGSARMILGFEAAGRPVDGELDLALAIARDHGGTVLDAGEGRSEAADAWRSTFFKQPFVRDHMLDLGLVVDTFETAIPWRAAAGFYESVRADTLAAVERACGQGGVLGRTTHVYPDGIAFYFTFFGPAGDGDRALAQWHEIKAAATESCVRHGGTASHHHACGRDHAPWMPLETPAVWQRALAGAKAAVDPDGRLNPGVILPAPGCETTRRP